MNDKGKFDNVFLPDDDRPTVVSDNSSLDLGFGEATEDIISEVDKEYSSMFYENSPKRREYSSRLIGEQRNANVKTTFILSLTGVLLSPLPVVGLVFSFIGSLRANFLLKKYENPLLKKARFFGILGTIINLFVIICTVLFLIFLIYN